MIFEALALVGGYVAVKKALALKRNIHIHFQASAWSSPLAKEIASSLNSNPEEWEIYCNELHMRKGNRKLEVSQFTSRVDVDGQRVVFFGFFDRLVIKSARKGWLGWKNAQLAKQFFGKESA